MILFLIRISIHPPGNIFTTKKKTIEIRLVKTLYSNEVKTNELF